ncbi:MAG: hypothetical protein HC888_00870 [Candidatus Competibacteraceae bacterium]|nr:hypothetical protein [Candidatus Competibacteraceae bacterium]
MSKILTVLAPFVKLLTGPTIFSYIEANVLLYMSATQLQNESKKQFNDRRRDAVVRLAKSRWPEVRTALMEFAIAFVVMRAKPKG